MLTKDTFVLALLLQLRWFELVEMCFQLAECPLTLPIGDERLNEVLLLQEALCFDPEGLTLSTQLTNWESAKTGIPCRPTGAILRSSAAA